LRERVAADRVVDDIGALAGSQLAHPVPDALTAVVDELVGTARPCDRELVGAARRGDDARAKYLAYLDRRQANPAGSAQYQERFPPLQMAPMGQRKVRGSVGHGERRGSHKIHGLGNRHHRRCVEHDLLRIAAAAQHGEHSLPAAQTDNPAAGFDHLTRGFEPWRKREWRLHLIGPADHQAVGEIDPGGAHPDADLARPQCTRWKVLQCQHVGRAPCAANHRLHPTLPGVRVSYTVRGLSSGSQSDGNPPHPAREAYRDRHDR
jgi:hypothetical protein